MNRVNPLRALFIVAVAVLLYLSLLIARSPSGVWPSHALASRTGQSCTVVFRNAGDDTNESVSGLLRAVNDEWVVVDGHLSTPGYTDEEAYYIPRKSVLYISFKKPTQT